MKRLSKFLGVLLLGVFVLSTVTSCHGRFPWSSRDTEQYDSADSLYVATLVEKAINPVYVDITSMLEARAADVAEQSIDSLWLTLPDNILEDVASVLIKQGIPITKHKLIKEYRQHTSVYDNLPPPANTASAPNDTTSSIDLSSTDLGARQGDSAVFQTSYKYRTDTVNGHPVKVLIKTEESYVR